MKILFICTHNRCRSILAEAIGNHLGTGLIRAISAGSNPAGTVHPQALEALKEQGIPVTGLHSKSWHDVENSDPDFVITVCDSAAGEDCPLWFGKSLRVHWNLPDPSTVEGGGEEMMQAYRLLISDLTGKMRKLHALLLENPDRTRILKFLQALEK